jgi:group I intron endonuclease
MSNTYCVYKHTAPNGKAYIGQTNNLAERDRTHRRANSGCRAFYNAIKKYGWDNFSHEILKDGLSLDEANYWEEFYINDHGTLSPGGYNLKEGGMNKKCSQETREKMSAWQKGVPKDPALVAIWTEKRKLHRPTVETKEKLRISSTGRKHSLETIEKIRSWNTGRKMPKEAVEKTASSKRGTFHSEETKRKMSEAQKSRHLSHGPVRLSEEARIKISKTKTGKKMSLETRAKMSASKKGVKHSPEHVAKRIANTTATIRAKKAAMCEKESQMKIVA